MLLALEMIERGLMDNIYPVMVGDKQIDTNTNTTTYTHYYRSNCHPRVLYIYTTYT